MHFIPWYTLGNVTAQWTAWLFGFSVSFCSWVHEYWSHHVLTTEVRSTGVPTSSRKWITIEQSASTPLSRAWIPSDPAQSLYSRSCPGKLIGPFLDTFFPSQMLPVISIISTFWEASVPYTCQKKKSSDIWCKKESEPTLENITTEFALGAKIKMLHV